MVDITRDFMRATDPREYIQQAFVDAAVYSKREGAGWHGIGTEIPDEIRKDPAKIATLLGAAYYVAAMPVFYKDGEGKFVAVPNHMAQVRDDTGETLSVTSEARYHTENRQPRDVFEAFRDEFQANRMELSHGAILRGGRIVVASALLDPDYDIVVGKGDRIRRYVTLSTGYDNRNGTVATEGEGRVVCFNTWRWAIADALHGKAGTKIASISASQKLAEGQLRQLISATAQLDGEHQMLENGGIAKAIAANSVAQVIAKIQARAKLEQRTYNEMANAEIAPASVLRYFADVLEVQIDQLDKTHADGRKMVSPRMQELMNTLTTAYYNAPGADMAKGTVWGAFNAVTHYATHDKPIRDSFKDGAKVARVASNMFGDAQRLKERAFQLALSQLKVAA